jgi:hypothetical protein
VPRYIEGFYLDEKDSYLKQIRRVYDALEDLYPWGGNDYAISEKSNVKFSTCRGYLKTELAKFTQDEEKRDEGIALSGPGKIRYNIENCSFVLKMEKQSGKGFSPGYVNYKQDFLDGWNKIVEKSEVEDIHEILVKFLGNIFTKMDSIPNDPTVKKIKPRLGMFPTQQIVTRTGKQIELKKDMRCDGCGINHEARDFIRAILLHLADLLEVNKEFIEFLFKKKFLNEKARDRFLEIAERKPIKTQRGKQTRPGILYFKAEKIGKVKAFPDKPQLILKYVHKKIQKIMKESWSS